MSCSRDTLPAGVCLCACEHANLNKHDETQRYQLFGKRFTSFIMQVNFTQSVYLNLVNLIVFIISPQ